MKYVYVLMFLLCGLLVKAEGIYFLRNGQEFKPLQDSMKLELKVLDNEDFTYVLLDSSGSYTLYADLELYDKIEGHVVEIKKGFDIRFANIDSIKRFLNRQKVQIVCKQSKKFKDVALHK